jgi:hypothetical protein
MRAYSIIAHGPSRSFPDGDPFRAAAEPGAPVHVHVGVGRSRVRGWRWGPAPVAGCAALGEGRGIMAR